MKAFNEFTKNFTKDRDKAITECLEQDSLEPFKKFHEKYTKLGVYNLALPKDEVLQITVMKIACNSRGVSTKLQAKAESWLKERGLRTNI